eukprot:5964838-Pyramimonas_sp.AAC.1
MTLDFWIDASLAKPGGRMHRSWAWPGSVHAHSQTSDVATVSQHGSPEICTSPRGRGASS